MNLKILFVITLLSFLSCSKKADIGYSGHGLNAIDEKTIQKYAPRALERSLSEEIELENEIRSTGLGQLSPNGKTMYFSWSVTGVKQVWKINGPKTFPVQLTGGENPTSLQDITHDGKFLILSRDQGGDEYPSLFIQDAALGGHLTKVFGENRVKSSYLTQSEDGSKIYYRANDIPEKKWGIYEFDIKSKERSLIFSGEGFWYIVEFGKDNEIILGHASGNISREFYIYNIRTKEKVSLIGEGEKESYYVRYSSIPGKYFVLTNKFDDFKRLYLYDGKKFEPISDKVSMDIDGLSISEDYSRILLRYNDQGYYRIKGINGQNFRPISLPSLKDATHSFFGTTTKDSRYTTFGQIFHNSPRVSYVYDWKTRKLEEWTIPSSPELDTKNYIKWSLEYYPAEDGIKIPMFVKRPKECIKKTCPVIISFHGGPESQSRPGFSPQAELYTKRGFVFVMPNVRGSSGYGKEWLNSDNGARRLDVITDVRDSANFIRENWAYDGVRPKIGVTGGSYGGYLTLYAMTVYADYFDAGVARVGMSSLVTFLENTAEYRRYLRETEYGRLSEDRDILEKLSPINHLEKLKSPLLIIQGANDPRVPAGEAIQFQQALEKRGVDSSLILFPDEGHGVKKRSNKTLSTGHALSFFIKWLH